MIVSIRTVCGSKAHAARIGLKAADFGAHSLRAGFLISAVRQDLAARRSVTLSSGRLQPLWLKKNRAEIKRAWEAVSEYH